MTMDSGTRALPAIRAFPSRDVAEVLLQAANDAGVLVEIRGESLLESAEPVAPGLHFDLSSWLPFLQAAALYLAGKAADGAIGDVGAQGLRRFARMVNDTVRRATRKPFVDAFIRYEDGTKRSYNLPGVDNEAAAEAILIDVGLAATHPLDRARFWVEGQWVGGQAGPELISRGDAFDDSALCWPSPRATEALDELSVLFGAIVRYGARDRDIGLALPPKATSELREDALRVIRRHLPHSVVGFNVSRTRIVIRDALKESDRASADVARSSRFTGLPPVLYAICIDKHPGAHAEHTAIRYIGFATASTTTADAEVILSLDEVLTVVDEHLSNLRSIDTARPERDVALIPAVHDGHRFIKTEADGDLPNNLLDKRPMNQAEKLRLAVPSSPGPAPEIRRRT